MPQPLRRLCRRTRAIAAAATLAALLAPGAAQAAGDQVSMMMDDDLLVYRDDGTRYRTMVAMKELGVDYVRVTVLWENVARGARSTSARRKRFRGDRPGTYPTRNWDRYDNLVKDARQLGLGVYFNVTGPGPSWARGRAPRGLRGVVRKAWRPKVGHFELFVKAVGRRYSGRFRDESDGRPLPRVSFWSLWNEPNQAGWLAPQWARDRRSGRVVPASPAMYRRLHVAGRRALGQTGHGRDTILMGETAPLGSSRRGTKSPIRPAVFLREVACVDRGLRRYRGAAARARGCTGPLSRRRLLASGYGHHPYTKNVGPTRRNPSRDAITLANVNDLGRLLDRLAARTKAVPRRLPLYMTEFGFETNPPDRFSGVSLARQAEWNQLGEYMAWTRPRVKSMTQFLLKDVPGISRYPRWRKSHWFTYQSGLLFANGAPKPSALAYRLPFVVRPAGRGALRLWGQLRFRPNGARDHVQLQFRPRGGAGFGNVGGPLGVAAARGFFDVTTPSRGAGEWRAVWTDPADARNRVHSLPAAGR